MGPHVHPRRGGAELRASLSRDRRPGVSIFWTGPDLVLRITRRRASHGAGVGGHGAAAGGHRRRQLADGGRHTQRAGPVCAGGGGHGADVSGIGLDVVGVQVAAALGAGKSGDRVASGIGAEVAASLARAGARVALRWGGGDEYSDNVDGNGRWSITIPAGAVPAAGVGQVAAYIIDAAGNRSDTSSRDVTVYGALVKPIIFPIAIDNQVNSAESLSPDSVVVRGLAPPMSLIRLTWGNAQIVKADEKFCGLKFQITLRIGSPRSISV